MIQNIDINFKRRHQLFEFGDLPWISSFTRDGIRAFLNASHRIMGYYKPWAKVLADALVDTGQNEVVVLGGGGLLLPRLLQKELRTNYNLKVKFYLTDLYPIEGLSSDLREGDDIVCVEESVDMLNVSSHYKGLRMIAVAFHHLNSSQAFAVLKDSFEKEVPICIFEYTRNSLMGVLSSFAYPIFNLLISPFVYPFHLSTLFLTYVIPYFPFIVSLDGLLSNLRTYSTSELNEMTGSLSKPTYKWTLSEPVIPFHPTKLTTLVGVPIQK